MPGVMAGDSKNASWNGIPLSYLSLVTLAFQNALLILVMHYSRIMPLVDGHRYFTSTAVFLNEVLKLIIACTVALRDTSKNLGTSPLSSSTIKALHNQVFSSDSWKLAIPAALYTFQNTLQYVAVSNLDAATFQVTYQLKILTTALFSVTMLKRSLTMKKWLSLVLLMAGIAVVQIPVDGKASSAGHKMRRDSGGDPPDEVAGIGGSGGIPSATGHAEMNRAVGLLAVIIACSTSGLAGVYFEKVLKDSNKVTLWVRNVQMSFYSLFPALFLGVILKDGSAIARDGFFAGYNSVVWSAIACQALGGLLVAVVVNYADNIAKNFATSISIILSFFASVWLFNFTITLNFIIGMVVVLYATYLYSSPDRRPALPPSEPPSEYRQPNIEDDDDDERAPALGVSNKTEQK